MRYHPSFEETSESDMLQIEEYLRAQNVSPEVVLAPIVARIAKDLTEFPYMYPVCQYDERYRQMPVNSYLVLYVVDEEKHRVEIHHIWHGMRNIEKLLDEKGRGTNSQSEL